jgi:hypothetical protein
MGMAVRRMLCITGRKDRSRDEPGVSNDDHKMSERHFKDLSDVFL